MVIAIHWWITIGDCNGESQFWWLQEGDWHSDGMDCSWLCPPRRSNRSGRDNHHQAKNFLLLTLTLTFILNFCPARSHRLVVTSITRKKTFKMCCHNCVHNFDQWKLRMKFSILQLLCFTYSLSQAHQWWGGHSGILCSYSWLFFKPFHHHCRCNHHSDHISSFDVIIIWRCSYSWLFFNHFIIIGVVTNIFIRYHHISRRMVWALRSSLSCVLDIVLFCIFLCSLRILCSIWV